MASDHELLQAWAAGDNAAGDGFIRRHFDALYWFFASKLDAADKAEDLTQKTFMLALERASGVRDPSRVRAFLFGIARNQLYLTYRDKPKHAVAEADSAMADAAAGPVSLLGRRDDEKALLHALRCLPMDLQVVVGLHYWEAMSVAEIAQIVEAPEGTVKYRLWNARDKLKAELARVDAAQEDIETTLRGLATWAREIRGRAVR